MSTRSLPEDAVLQKATIRYKREFNGKLHLIKWVTGEVELVFLVPGRQNITIIEKIKRLGTGAFKVVFSVENWKLVLKVCPRRGQNRQYWMTEYHNPLQELEKVQQAGEKTNLRPFLPRYYGGVYLYGDPDYNLTTDSDSRRVQGNDTPTAALMVCDRVAMCMQDALLQMWTKPMTAKLRDLHDRLWITALSMIGTFFENGWILWDAKVDNFGMVDGDVTRMQFVDLAGLEERSVRNTKYKGQLLYEIMVVFCKHTLTVLQDPSFDPSWRWVGKLFESMKDDYFGQGAGHWCGKQLYWSDGTCSAQTPHS